MCKRYTEASRNLTPAKQRDTKILISSTVCGPVSGQVQFPATFRKSSFLVKKRTLIKNYSFQTFIDVSSFIISSGDFQVDLEGGNFKFT